MAKKKDTKKKRKSRATLSLGVALPLMSTGVAIYHDYRAQGLDQTIKDTIGIYTGLDIKNNRFNSGQLWYGLFPLLGGIAIHKIASSWGINRALGQAKIPFIRI